ncbi:hypothetical protein HBI57_014760 [Parastagonospora nodorum]|nr:hypothetical protein HBI57_014760 [Parastagonospora nodorum]
MLSLSRMLQHGSSIVSVHPCLLDIATGQTGVTSATAATAAISTTRHIDRVHMMVMRLNNAIDDYIIVISMHFLGTPVQK